MRDVITFGTVELGASTANDVFDRIVAGPHQIATRCDVVFDGAVIEEDLPIVSAAITYDRTAARLASVSNLIVEDPTRLPGVAGDRLSPNGYELRLWRGVQVGAGQLMAPLGVFPIQQSSMDAVAKQTAVTAVDRSQRISDSRFPDVYSVAAGTNYATAIQDLIESVVPGLEFLFPSTTFTTPPVLAFPRLSDPWLAAIGMAKSIGMELKFDGLGRLVMNAEPSFADSPTFRFAEAENLVSASLGLDRGPAWNRVDAISSNASSTEVYTGSAIDDDPSSRSYYYGPFGKKPKPGGYASPFLNSTAQCDSAAAAILASNLGVAATAMVSTVPNPRIETSDVGLVSCSRLGLDELHIIDGQTISLAATDVMTADVRAQQVAS